MSELLRALQNEELHKSCNTFQDSVMWGGRWTRYVARKIKLKK